MTHIFSLISSIILRKKKILIKTDFVAITWF